MCLFWVLCWCLQIVKQCGTVNILGDNFRNSRFGQFLFPVQLGEFPVRPLGEFAGEGLDCLALIRAEWGNRRNSRFNGKSREFRQQEAGQRSRSLGSRASRNESPKRLKPKTVRAI